MLGFTPLAVVPLASIGSGVSARVYATVINVPMSVGYTGTTPRSEANKIDASAYTSGDLSSTSGGSVINKNYGNTIGVHSDLATGVPLFKRYVTTISADGVTTRSVIRTFGTIVGVRGKGTSLIDGRRDILFTNGYRR